MRTLITIISFAAFLLHLTLGCCWHHEHAAVDLIPTAANPVGHHHPHGASHHHHHDEESEVPAEPQPGHDDCHESHCVCQVISPVSLEVDSSSIAWVMPVLLVADSVSHSRAYSFALMNSSRFSTLPVRLHLWQQSFLN